MERQQIQHEGREIPYFPYHTVVVGSGAAGLNAAARLFDMGCTSVALVTEGMNMGTSRNTGSDKQTYYRLAETGESGDSIEEMARSLYGGGAADQDIAYCEAAGSLRAFYRLVELGVAFPHDRYGNFTGYKTDHDPKARATSAGPSTSRFMTEALEAEVRRRGIDIFDGYEAVRICKDGGAVAGLIALEKKTGGFAAFGARNIVYATGGPAGLYRRSVYPGSQTGATGAALEAGAWAQNLTEWQYGIASVKFRWNLSGSYQQVLPRYVSTDAGGGDAREFLSEWFSSPQRMYDAIFLKGYQWPFDPRKVLGEGSSLIDLLVYHETEIRGRRVFLDFTQNPGVKPMDFSLLSAEPYAYLERIHALFGTPVERLRHINAPAITLYRQHGIDLEREWLEIQVAAQHCNGGLAGDIWWHSNIEGFFPVGEVNGSHGVYRPGGSALNAGQVGSFRAAQYIAARRRELRPLGAEAFSNAAAGDIAFCCDLAQKLVANAEGLSPRELLLEIGESMSLHGAFIRHPGRMKEALGLAKRRLAHFAEETRADQGSLAAAFRCRDLLITQCCMLTAMLDYMEQGGRSRGSYLVCDEKGQLPLKGMDERFRFALDDGARNGQIQQVAYDGGVCSPQWRLARQLPNELGDAFENVWSSYLADGIIR